MGDLGSAAAEAKCIISAIERGALTLAQARDLIGVTSERAALAEYLRHPGDGLAVRQALWFRAAVLTEFEKLLSRKK